MMLSPKIADRERVIADYLPYSYHVEDSIISTKAGEYLSVWKLEGRAHEAASEQEHYLWLEDLNTLFRSFGAGHIGLYSHVVRRRVDGYKEGEFRHVFPRQLDAKYRRTFDVRSGMVNELFLTIVYRPQADALVKVLAGAEKLSAKERAERQAAALKTLAEINRQVRKSMKMYRPQLLGAYERGGNTYSHAMEFFAYLVNGDRMPMPITRDRICETIPQARVLFAPQGEVGELRTVSKSRYFSMVEVVDFPEKTEPGQFNGLLEADYEFVFTQSFATVSKQAAKSRLEKQQRSLVQTDDAGTGQIAAINTALQGLIEGWFVIGEYHGTLMVFGDTEKQARENAAQASATIIDHEATPKPIDRALEAAFWAQAPGNWSWRPRPVTVTSLNFLSFSSFHNFMGGKATGNPWGQAVTALRGRSGQPYYFNFHPSPRDADATGKRLPGNTLFLGPTGAGKTVLLNFLINQAAKFDPGVVAIDKDRGMEPAIRAMGGRYLALKNGEPSGFNPFQIELTPANMMFLAALIRRLVASGGNRVTHKDEAEIQNALKALKLLDQEDRRLSALLRSLPNPYDPSADHPTVAARLQRWCEGGEFGWLFDNETDGLDVTTHRVYGFDVTDFLDNEDVRAPVLMYLIFRTEKMIDGRPFIYCIDEFWKALGDPVFENLARDQLKTIRKKNGIFVLASQEPNDALSTKIASTMIEQCKTMVLLPNKLASSEHYQDGLKLTASEFELLKSLPEGGRQFLVKQGDQTAVVELDLHGFDDELLILSGTPDNADLIDVIRAEVGDDPAAWLPEFFRRKRQERSFL